MSDEWQVQWSFKVNDEMDNVRGADVDDFLANLDRYSQKVEEIANLKAGIRAVYTVVNSVVPVGASQPQQWVQQPQAPQQRSYGSGGSNAHPDQPPGPPPVGPDGLPMEFKTGEKNGRTWKAWMSPHRKGDPRWIAPQWI